MSRVTSHTCHYPSFEMNGVDDRRDTESLEEDEEGWAVVDVRVVAFRPCIEDVLF